MHEGLSIQKMKKIDLKNDENWLGRTAEQTQTGF